MEDMLYVFLFIYFFSLLLIFTMVAASISHFLTSSIKFKIHSKLFKIYSKLFRMKYPIKKSPLKTINIFSVPNIVR